MRQSFTDICWLSKKSFILNGNSLLLHSAEASIWEKYALVSICWLQGLTILTLWWHPAHWAHEAVTTPSGGHQLTRHPNTRWHLYTRGGEDLGETAEGANSFTLKIIFWRVIILHFAPQYFKAARHQLNCVITKADNCKTSPHSKSMVVNKSQDNHISIFCRIPYALKQDKQLINGCGILHQNVIFDVTHASSFHSQRGAIREKASMAKACLCSLWIKFNWECLHNSAHRDTFNWRSRICRAEKSFVPILW